MGEGGLRMLGQASASGPQQQLPDPPKRTPVPRIRARARGACFLFDSLRFFSSGDAGKTVPI